MSSETAFQPTSNDPERTSINNNQDGFASFREQFESLEIPPNIDPRLLELWLDRERAEIEKTGKPPKRLKPRTGRKLNKLFSALIGILAMCLVIVLGLIHGREADEILKSCCQAFLFYAVVGFFVGCLLENCISNSVETLFREIVRRSDEAALNAAEEFPPEMNADLTHSKQ